MTKHEVVTFKVDGSLLELMKGIENRSNFIRTALLRALENTCPLCRGSGILTPSKKEHWDKFSKQHSVKECGDCHELTIVCEKKK
ncbi:MAG: CopG family transcriptional regulator [Candidatus Omnitrophica bacterium]|nr:CopG family transcriptional regulator [Candidatus Omnitrophota bacterium]